MSTSLQVTNVEEISAYPWFIFIQPLISLIFTDEKLSAYQCLSVLSVVHSFSTTDLADIHGWKDQCLSVFISVISGSFFFNH